MVMATGTTEPDVDRRRAVMVVVLRGFLGGGRGIGGSACLVCSYRSAIRPESSRKVASRAAGRDLWRTLGNFWGAMGFRDSRGRVFGSSSFDRRAFLSIVVSSSTPNVAGVGEGNKRELYSSLPRWLAVRQLYEGEADDPAGTGYRVLRE